MAWESERRARLGVPAFAGGVLYVLSGIILSATLKNAPTVGVLQGIAPALRGVPDPLVSPRAGEVRFASEHAFGLLVGSVLQALALAILIVVLLFLLQSVSFRRPEVPPAARPLVLFGGGAFAAAGLVAQIVRTIQTHAFAVGHDFSNHAVEEALTPTAYVVVELLGLLVGIVFAAGMVIVVLNAMRVGLLVRWMGMLGIVMAVLVFTPFGIFFGGALPSLLVAFWMVGLGILLLGRWAGGDPPGWAAGEARPWPTAAERTGARRGGSGEAAEVVPEPAQVGTGSSARNRRKRGARG
ncbi:MAG TPA: hypothetical protein VGX16_02640 [Solirubrobacteraceae bacterium]|nr:hypothetical protein [Solirubrobacteraceae bacterium]